METEMEQTMTLKRCDRCRLETPKDDARGWIRIDGWPTAISKWESVKDFCKNPGDAATPEEKHRLATDAVLRMVKDDGQGGKGPVDLCPACVQSLTTWWHTVAPGKTAKQRAAARYRELNREKLREASRKYAKKA
jgi:hypothetical protein